MADTEKMSAKEAAEARAMAHRVAELREMKGLTQSEVARLAGIEKSGLSRLEKGQRAPDRVSAQLIISLARILDTTPEYLVVGDPHMRVRPPPVLPTQHAAAIEPKVRRVSKVAVDDTIASSKPRRPRSSG